MDKRVTVAQADLIVRGLITEAKPGVWRLTSKGKHKAMEIFTSIGASNTALVMIATVQTIEEVSKD